MKLLVLPFLFISLMLHSQNYSTAVGIKGGYPGFGTLNVKHFLSGNHSIEGSIGGFASAKTKGSGAFILLDYEINNGLESVFSWHYGAGGLIGFTNNLDDRPFLHTGINGLIGLEYNFQEVPINCSLDTGPFIFFTPLVNFAWGGGLAIRYAIR